MMHRGEGLYVWDVQGRRYLDATSGGVWCVNVGYGRASIADAVRDQLVELNYFAGTLGSPVAARFAEALIEKMPGMSRVYFSNSGSEANEKAYKMVRQIAHRKYAGRKHKIFYRERDYHGTTVTCLSSTGQQERRMQYGPFTPGFVEFPHCCEYRSQFGPVDDYGARAGGHPARGAGHHRRGGAGADHRRWRRHHSARGLPEGRGSDLPQVRHPHSHR